MYKHKSSWAIRKASEDGLLTTIGKDACIKQLRLIDWHNYDTFLLARHHNLIVGSEDPKDKKNLVTILKIANSIIEYYAEHEDTAEIDDGAYAEFVNLAGLRNPKIFRALLGKTVNDIKNDPFLEVYKLNVLTTIVLNVAGVDAKVRPDYCDDDALKTIVDLIRSNLEKLCVTEESENLQLTLDAFNLMLNLMGSLGLQGLRGDASDKLNNSLTIFQQTTE